MFDYDNTLAPAGRPLHEGVADLLRDLRNRYVIVLASARAFWSLEQLVDEGLFDWIISDCGARTRRRKCDVHTEALSTAVLQAILELTDRPALAANTLEGLLYEARYAIVNPHRHATQVDTLSIRSDVLRLFVASPLGASLVPADLTALVAVDTPLWPGVVSLRPSRATKLHRLRNLLTEIGANTTDVTVVGNSPEDDDILLLGYRRFVVGKDPGWRSTATATRILPDHSHIPRLLRALH